MADTVAGDSDAVGWRGFGGYTRHFWSTSIPKKPHNELAWVTFRYTPAKLRVQGPTQSQKFLKISTPTPGIPPYWVTTPTAPLKSFSRADEESEIIGSYPSTRSQEWSTLRQMLPSQRAYVKQSPPSWGISDALVLPSIASRQPKRYPKINSSMTM